MLLVGTMCLPAAAQDFKAYEQTVPGTAVKFKMIPVKAGTFLMGSPAGEKGRDDDEGPQRKTPVSAFWIAEHEATFAEWDAFFKIWMCPKPRPYR